jgi:hypothetical protein
MTYTPIATQSRPGSDAYSGERLVNYFARPASGLSPAVLLARGGLTARVELYAEVRAMVEFGGALYVAAGGQLYRIIGSTATAVGGIADGPTQMVSDARYIGIVAAGRYFVFDGTSVTSPDTGALTDPVGIAYLDGYFILIGTAGGRADGFTISGLDDPTTFGGLDFAFAESAADPLVGAITDHNELWLFGTRTVQPFYNAGAADFPILPNKGALVEHGCLLGGTIAKADNAVFWVRPDGKVARSFGSQPEWISTPEISDEIARSTITGGFTFSERGHEFYALTRATGTTLVYDISTGLWHERSAGLSYGPWQARNAIQVGGEWFFGCAGGQVATASEATYTDFGGDLLNEVESPLTTNKGDRFRVTRIHADFAGGRVDLGRDPQVMLQTTRDGELWGLERWRDLGSLGAYKRRAVWHALGQFRQGAMRLRITDPVQRDLIGVSVTYG